MPKAPVTKSKPQASIPGRKGANKKNGAAKKPVGKPRVQVSFESGAAGAKASQLKKEDVKGKGRAEDTELVESGDEDVTMTESNVKTDDEEDTKPDISKLNGEAPKKRKTDATRNEKFLVIAGSYEKNMYGLEIDVKDYRSSDPETAPPIVKPIFIFPAHLSCIKTVAASPEGGKFLASGSDDEFVKVWDLRRRKEIGSLSQHVGSITSLVFPTRSHLLAASEDSTISLFRTRDWALLRSLKGHSGRINCIDVHPSGKVALSVGKDKTLKMWDLMRGRGAASLALGVEAEVVKFTEDGKHFAILTPQGIDVYSTRMTKIGTIPSTRRLHDIVFAKMDETEYLLTGTEEGKLLLYRLDFSEESIEKGTACQQLGALAGHSNRIKAISHMKMELADGPVHFVTTVSSDGNINIHDLTRSADILQSNTTEDFEIPPIATYDTKGSRLVCCCTAEVFRGKAQLQGKTGVKEETAGDEVKDEEGSVDGGDDFYDQGGEASEQEHEDEYEMEAE
ncbi:Protein mak11 [Naganishia albida]|nr:Protein mak11 [Naganishia albida]